MKASVIIANYNGEKYIKKCLDSLKNQTTKDFEIIIFDDSSTDNSLKIIENYNKIKIKLIKNKRRTKFGCFNQINAYKKALNKSKGSIIFFLDSDDWFMPSKIKTILNVFKKKEKIDFVFDKPFVKSEEATFKLKKKKIISTYWSEFQPQSCISARRKKLKFVLNKIGIKSFPDVWLDFRIGIYSKFIEKNFYLLNKYLTVYRHSESNVSSKFKKYSKNWWRRRLESHNFFFHMISKNNKYVEKNMDYYFTRFINSIV